MREIFENLVKDLKENATSRRMSYYNEIKNNIQNAINSGCNTMKALRKDGPYKYSNAWSMTPESRIQDRLVKTPGTASYNLNNVIEIRSDVENYIASTVEREVNEMFECFITKQTEKTNDIIKGRKVNVRGTVYPGSLEAELFFNVESTGTFTMRCQIVHKVSCRGNYFWQFPTTFHNVEKHDGTKISPPSEKNMKKLF